jgi:MoaA/NifB/PqqE/SkfB family radical SAM enzyme
MKKLIKIQSTRPETYIYWMLTDFCNQKCSYCPSWLNSGSISRSKFAPTYEQIDKFLNKLSDMAASDPGRKFFVCLSGGEPTTQNLFPEIIERLKLFADVHVITNGTRDVSYWKTFNKLPDHVIITLHPEYYDSKKNRINSLTEYLSNNGVRIRYNLMCHPDHWDTVMNIYNNIDDKFKPFVIKKIIHDYQDLKNKPSLQYTEEQINFIRQNHSEEYNMNRARVISYYDDGSTDIINDPNKLMADQQNFFEGWKCSAGKEIISVDPYGLVYAGICKVRRLGILENFQFLEEFVTCTKKSCVCPADICTSKYKE